MVEADRSETAATALHATLDADFEDAVLAVQLEHELAGYETVEVTRLDRLVAGTLDREVPRTALIVVCHPEIALEAIEIAPALAGMLPCTTAVYESPEDDLVHVRHVSVAKAIRDLGLAPVDADGDVDALVETAGETMERVWANVEALGDGAAADDGAAVDG